MICHKIQLQEKSLLSFLPCSYTFCQVMPQAVVETAAPTLLSNYLVARDLHQLSCRISGQ